MDKAGLTSVLLVVLISSGACVPAETTPDRTVTSALPTPSASTFSGAQQVLVSRASTRGPEVCHPENVGRLVVGFFAAVNQGDVGQALEFLTDDLGWYSMTAGNPRRGGSHFVAYETVKLRSYLEERADQDERMYLVSMDVEYERPPGNVAHVAYTMQRTADDLIDLAPDMHGKGAIDCDVGRISIWSMAQRKRPAPGQLCPGEPDPPEIALVCARE